MKIDDDLEDMLEDFTNQVKKAVKQFKGDMQMALDATTIALLARIDAATNGIAARIQAFVDAALKAGGATPAEINAALQPEVDKLEGIANNPNEPVPLAISIAPTLATVAPGATQQFTATVSGGDPAFPQNTGAKYSAVNGTIDSTGLYTAPATAGTDTVTAVAKGDATVSASAAVTVQ